MTKFETLDKLCLHEIADLMSAEKQILKALPGVIKRVTSPELEEALQDHLKQIETHLDRLEKAADTLGNDSLRAHHCKGMEGLLMENSEFVDEAEGDESVIDAGIIAGLRRVEHYEIAAYETLCGFLSQLGEDKAAALCWSKLLAKKMPLIPNCRKSPTSRTSSQTQKRRLANRLLQCRAYRETSSSSGPFK